MFMCYANSIAKQGCRKLEKESEKCLISCIELIFLGAIKRLKMFPCNVFNFLRRKEGLKGGLIFEGWLPPWVKKTPLIRRIHI